MKTHSKKAQLFKNNCKVYFNSNSVQLSFILTRVKRRQRLPNESVVIPTDQSYILIKALDSTKFC